jgi:phage recombination protein Bet
MNNKNELAVVEEKTLLDFLLIGNQKINDLEKKQFIEIAKAYNLNPFKREIYLQAYGEGEYRTLSITIGYEVYLKRAERTGLLDGWETRIFNDESDLCCEITIYRKDRKFPFKHTTYFSECAQRRKNGDLNVFWNTKPKFMLKKVAIAQGFRLCFPDELGGMPYTADELGEIEINPVQEQTTNLKDKLKKKIDSIETIEPKEDSPQINKFITEFEGAVNLANDLESLNRVREHYKEEYRLRFGKINISDATKMKEIFDNKKSQLGE